MESSGLEFARLLGKGLIPHYRKEYWDCKNREYSLGERLGREGIFLVMYPGVVTITGKLSARAKVTNPRVKMPSPSAPPRTEAAYHTLTRTIHIPTENISPVLVIHELAHHVVIERKQENGDPHGESFLSAMEELTGYFEEEFLQEKDNESLLK